MKRLAVAAVSMPGAAAFFGEPAEYRRRPERMVVNIGPGSSVDIIAWALATKLTERRRPPAPPRPEQ